MTSPRSGHASSRNAAGVSESRRRPAPPGAVELVDESVHLLRLMPAHVLARYYAGALPFVLGFLWFWVDFSRGAASELRCLWSSLALALLYLWMKCWQADFGRHIRARLGGKGVGKRPISHRLRQAAAQAAIHSTGPFVLPPALLLTLPFGWCYAFYQNATVCGEDEPAPDLSARCRLAWSLAKLHPAQNHRLMGVLFVFGLCTLLNAAVFLFLTPQLVKWVTGTESTFTLSGMGLLNTTFLAVSLGLTYLCVDPLIKTAYALRCWYGSSLETGEDLRSQLAVIVRRATVVWVLTAVLGTLPAHPARAADRVVSPPAAASVSTDALDRAIDETLKSRRYAWRDPGHGTEPEDESDREEIGGLIGAIFRALGGWVVAAWDWVRGLWPDPPALPAPRDPGGEFPVQTAFWLLLGILILVLVMTFFRSLRRTSAARTRPEPPAAAPEIPNLELPQVAADALPADRWLTLAGELSSHGDFRLALRARHLAALAHLAAARALTLADHKSDRDYQRELQRRTHDHPRLLSAFEANVGVFERAWYGRYPVDHHDLETFAADQQEVLSFGRT